MVEFRSQHNTQQIILSPNRSMSWQANKKVLLGLFMVNMTIALSWTWMGAWMVLPFAGLEIFLVGLGMYYVSWKLNFKEVITLHSETLTVQKGIYFPKQEWRLSINATTLLKQPSHYRMSAPSLFLNHLDERIEIGHFLNRTDKICLRKQLTKWGIQLITVSSK